MINLQVVGKTMNETENRNSHSTWGEPRPEDIPPTFPYIRRRTGERAELMKDPRWGGQPPVGENPIENRYMYLLELLILMGIEIAIWGLYRYLSAPILGDAFSSQFFYFHIVAAPSIHLTPLILYWHFRLRERGLPFMFTRKNLFTAVLMGLIAAVVMYILNQKFDEGLLSNAGFISGEGITLTYWLTAEPGWFILMMFTFFFIVGPVEELQHRGFLQDQINRVYDPWVGILISAFFFGAGHLPIYFILYDMTPDVAVITMMYTFSFGILMSLFYHWSRNIIGPIVLHGFWDWQLFVYGTAYSLENISFESMAFFSFIGWLASALAMAIIAILFYFAYRIWWKGKRPAGSLGFEVPGVSSLFRPEGFIARTGWKIKNFFLFRGARNFDKYNTTIPKVFTIIFMSITILIFCFGVMGVSAIFGESVDDAFGSSAGSGDSGGEPVDELLVIVPGSTSGYTNENSATDLPLTIEEENLIEVSCQLTWTDEATAYFRGTNQPDEFKVIIIAPDGNTMAESGFDTSGMISVTADLTSDEGSSDMNYQGGWTIHIEAGECGDDEGPLGLRSSADNGNDWDLEYSFSYEP